MSESLKERLVKLHSTCYWISIRRTGSVSTHHSEDFSRSQSMIDVWVAIRADCRFPLEYLGLWQLSSQLRLIGILLDNREKLVRPSVCVSSGVTPAYQNLWFFLRGCVPPSPLKLGKSNTLCMSSEYSVTIAVLPLCLYQKCYWFCQPLG